MARENLKSLTTDDLRFRKADCSNKLDDSTIDIEDKRQILYFRNEICNELNLRSMNKKSSSVLWEHQRPLKLGDRVRWYHSVPIGGVQWLTGTIVKHDQNTRYAQTRRDDNGRLDTAFQPKLI